MVYGKRWKCSMACENVGGKKKQQQKDDDGIRGNESEM